MRAFINATIKPNEHLLWEITNHYHLAYIVLRSEGDGCF